jgi:hypothetical protein
LKNTKEFEEHDLEVLNCLLNSNIDNMELHTLKNLLILLNFNLQKFNSNIKFSNILLSLASKYSPIFDAEVTIKLKELAEGVTNYQKKLILKRLK